MEWTAEKYASNSTPNGIASATVLAHTHPSADRCEKTASAMSITAGRAKKEEFSLGSAIVVAVVGTIIRVGGRYIISTDAAEADIDTGYTRTDRNGGQAETMESG